MAATFWIRVGAILGGLAVVAGAFGAHALRQRFQLDERWLATFETGVRYQMYHALALLAVGLLALARPDHAGGALNVAGWCFLVGVIMFSGSLYLLTLGLGPARFWGPITPLGGTVLIIGWCALVVASTRG